MKRTTTLVLLVLCLYSCISIQGLYDGYRSLSSSNKEKVVRRADLGRMQKPPDNLIVLVSDVELLEIIRQDTCTYQMIYMFNKGANI